MRLWEEGGEDTSPDQANSPKGTGGGAGGGSPLGETGVTHFGKMEFLHLPGISCLLGKKLLLCACRVTDTKLPQLQT